MIGHNSGILLDTKGSSNKRSETALQYIINAFLTLNVLECFSVVVLAYLLRIESASSGGRSSTRASTVDASRTRISPAELQALEQEAPLLIHDNDIRALPPDDRYVPKP